jgi:hypothetical protein
MNFRRLIDHLVGGRKRAYRAASAPRTIDVVAVQPNLRPENGKLMAASLKSGNALSEQTMSALRLTADIRRCGGNVR